MDLYRKERLSFLRQAAAEFACEKTLRLLVVTHCLEDRPDFVRVLSSMYHIARVVPIPYSVDESAVREIASDFQVDRLPLARLTDARALLQFTSDIVAEDEIPLIIVEIGGYHAQVVDELKLRFPNRVIGCVESTESGHQAYVGAETSVPVVSVARSPLKSLEHNLIAASLAFSLEARLRNLGLPLTGLSVGILGHGRVGSSLARILAGRQARVMVYDIDPIARIAAYTEGHLTPPRRTLLEEAQVIIGASGQTSLLPVDLDVLKNGCILASASSKGVELDLGGSADEKTDIVAGIGLLRQCGGKSIYLLSDGYPANFLDRAVAGPILSLVHAEIIAALSTIQKLGDSRGMHYVSAEHRNRLCDLWAQIFLP
jgi:adenosylhomocysteinase